MSPTYTHKNESFATQSSSSNEITCWTIVFCRHKRRWRGRWKTKGNKENPNQHKVMKKENDNGGMIRNVMQKISK